MRHFRRRRRFRDDGAAAVEFALLFPLFLVLTFGMISAGTAFSRQINLTQAAREASRYGASYDISGIGGGASLTTRIQTWLTAVDNAVQQSAGSANNAIGGYDYRCVAFVHTNGDGSVNNDVSTYMETTTGSASNTGTGPCPTVTAPAIKGTYYAQVVLRRGVNFFYVVSGATINLNASNVTPYEGTRPPT